MFAPSLAPEQKFRPPCADFTTSRHSTYFDFATLNLKNDYVTSGIANISLIKDALIEPSTSHFGLDAWRDAAITSGLSSFNVSGVYRNPKHNFDQTPKGAKGSRRMFTATLLTSSLETTLAYGPA